MTTTPARSRVTLTGISSRAWEHPADRDRMLYVAGDGSVLDGAPRALLRDISIVISGQTIQEMGPTASVKSQGWGRNCFRRA